MELTIIGQGVKKLSHLTVEGLAALRRANKVLHVAIDSGETSLWLKEYGNQQ